MEKLYKDMFDIYFMKMLSTISQHIIFFHMNESQINAGMKYSSTRKYHIKHNEKRYFYLQEKSGSPRHPVSYGYGDCKP